MDGDYVGLVDDFDGVFHHLNLSPGPHHIDVRAPGYDAFGVDVIIQRHHTTEYRGQVAAGHAGAPRERGVPERKAMQLTGHKTCAIFELDPPLGLNGARAGRTGLSKTPRGWVQAVVQHELTMEVSWCEDAARSPRNVSLQRFPGGSAPGDSARRRAAACYARLGLQPAQLRIRGDSGDRVFAQIAALETNVVHAGRPVEGRCAGDADLSIGELSDGRREPGR